MELSRQQQVNQCCGLAAATYNASLVRFYNTIKLLGTDTMDLDIMLQAFKETEYSYLFKPEILPDSAKFAEIKARNEYVRQFGQEEFDNLKSLVDHFQTIPAKSSNECDQLLDSFDNKLMSQQNMKQIEKSYLQALTISYNKLLEEQNSKQIQKDEKVAQDLHSQDAKLIDSDRLFAKNLVIDELAINIGEKIGKKLFGEDMSKSRVADTEAIVVHLKEIILPSLQMRNCTNLINIYKKLLGK